MGRIQKMNSSLLFFSFLVVQVHLINGQLSQRLGRPNYLYGRSPVLQPPRYEVRQLTLLVISRDYFGHGPQKAFSLSLAEVRTSVSSLVFLPLKRETFLSSKFKFSLNPASLISCIYPIIINGNQGEPQQLKKQ